MDSQKEPYKMQRKKQESRHIKREMHGIGTWRGVQQMTERKIVMIVTSIDNLITMKLLLRWCIEKPDKRKSRKMSNKLFSAMMYDMMGWDTDCRYKILGHKITHEDETIDNKTLDTLKKNKNITLLTLQKLCRILGCTPNDVVQFTEDN